MVAKLVAGGVGVDANIGMATELKVKVGSETYSRGQNCFNVARTWIVLLITHEGKMIKS